MNQEWLDKYGPLCNTLLQLGWFVPPFITGADFGRVEKICIFLNESETLTNVEKKDVDQRIDYIISDIAFHPNYRAFYVSRALEMDHIKEFSHLYEQAVICYYKREYSSSILTLLPALEGILLSFLGWKFGESRKPAPKKIIKKIIEYKINSQFESLNLSFQMYQHVLAEFLERWVYQDTSKADFSVSFLNRHLLLHGMEPKASYHPSDVHRLFLLFDLIVEFFSYIEDKHFNFIPSDKPEINFRRVYYSQLGSGSLSIAHTWEFDQEFLKQHKNYENSAYEPSLAKSEMKTMLELMETMSMLSKVQQ